MILLDTSVLSLAFRRARPGPKEEQTRAQLEQLMAGDQPVGLPGIVLQETLSGIRSAQQFAELEGKLLASFEIVSATPDEHVAAARLKNTCLGKGLNVSGIDCLIAALAIAGGHELFTADSDFRAIANHAPLKLYRGGP